MLDDHHHGAAHLSVWLPQPFGAQEALIGSDPERFFRPPYVGVSGWVGVVLDMRPDWDAVAALVRDAFLTVALRSSGSSPWRRREVNGSGRTCALLVPPAVAGAPGRNQGGPLPAEAQRRRLRQLVGRASATR